MAEVSVLVPFTSSDNHRFRLYEFVTARVLRRLPEAELCVAGDDSVPFNKSRALNRAAARATTDVFYILDSDTWLSEDTVMRCVEGIKASPERWAHPWVVKTRLDEATTGAVLAAGARWDGHRPPGAAYEKRNPYWAAPPLLLSRMQWETVGGMDEGFDRGWGLEDTSFALALKCLFGRAIVLDGECIHLWHPRIGRAGNDRWEGQVDGNNGLYMKYKRASRHPEAMRQFIESRRAFHYDGTVHQPS